MHRATFTAAYNDRRQHDTPQPTAAEMRAECRAIVRSHVAAAHREGWPRHYDHGAIVASIRRERMLHTYFVGRK